MKKLVYLKKIVRFDWFYNMFDNRKVKNIREIGSYNFPGINSELSHQ